MRLSVALVRLLAEPKIKIILPMFLSMIAGIILYVPSIPITIDYFHTDDVYLIDHLSSVKDISSAFQFVFGTLYFKFRPVANIQYLLEYILFGDSYILYIMYNIFMIEVLVFVFLLFFYQKSGLLECLFLALILISSKFLLYQAWNITGSFETLAAILFLTILLLLYRRVREPRYLMVLIIALLLTSERFLPFCLFVPIFYFYIFRSDYRSHFIGKALCYSALILGLYIIFRLAMKMPLVVGTQDHDVLHNFSLLSFIQHVAASYGEIFGFSIGPRYLTGFELVTWVAPMYLWGHTMYIFSLIISSVLFVFCIYYWMFTCFLRNSNIVILNLISLLMISAASVTFRLELRWLLPSFLVMLLIFSQSGNSKISGNGGFRLMAFNTMQYYLIMILFVFYNINYAMNFRGGLYFSEKINSSSILMRLFAN